LGTIASTNHLKITEKPQLTSLITKKITHRLAKVRKLISKNFDPTLGKDDMDDIERHLEGIKFWAPNKI